MRNIFILSILLLLGACGSNDPQNAGTNPAAGDAFNFNGPSFDGPGSEDEQVEQDQLDLLIFLQNKFSLSDNLLSNEIRFNNTSIKGLVESTNAQVKVCKNLYHSLQDYFSQRGSEIRIDMLNLYPNKLSSDYNEVEKINYMISEFKVLLKDYIQEEISFESLTDLPNELVSMFSEDFEMNSVRGLLVQEQPTLTYYYSSSMMKQKSKKSAPAFHGQANHEEIQAANQRLYKDLMETCICSGLSSYKVCR